MQRPMARPIGVTLIAVLVAINGILNLIGGILSVGAGSTGALSALVGVVFGLVLLYIAYGLWTLQRWAWIATLIFQGLNALFSVLTIAVAPTAIGAWVSLVLAVVIIVYLVQPNVRADFGQRWTNP